MLSVVLPVHDGFVEDVLDNLVRDLGNELGFDGGEGFCRSIVCEACERGFVACFFFERVGIFYFDGDGEAVLCSRLIALNGSRLVSVVRYLSFKLEVAIFILEGEVCLGSEFIFQLLGNNLAKRRVDKGRVIGEILDRNGLDFWRNRCTGEGIIYFAGSEGGNDNDDASKAYGSSFVHKGGWLDFLFVVLNNVLHFIIYNVSVQSPFRDAEFSCGSTLFSFVFIEY